MNMMVFLHNTRLLTLLLVKYFLKPNEFHKSQPDIFISMLNMIEVTLRRPKNRLEGLLYLYLLRRMNAEREAATIARTIGIVMGGGTDGNSADR